MYTMGFWTCKFSEEQDVYCYHFWLKEGVPQYMSFGKQLSRFMAVFRKTFENANNRERCFETDKECFTHCSRMDFFWVTSEKRQKQETHRSLWTEWHSWSEIERQADNWRTHLHMPQTVRTIKLFNFEQDLNHGEFDLINKAGTEGALTINTWAWRFGICKLKIQGLALFGTWL